MPDKDHITPPRFSIRLIRWLCKSDLVEELEGNLHEYYAEQEKTTFSKIRYWYQVLNYLRPSVLKSPNLKFAPMFNFNPILTIRNLYRHKAYSIINISGFTIGLVSATFLYFYVYSELDRDSFHIDKDEIYRVARVGKINGEAYDIGVTSGPFANGLKDDFPLNIKSVTRAWPNDGLITYKDRKFQEDHLLFADKNFFEFFSFPLKIGEASTVLSNANDVVISKKMATKYFGELNPIGEVIQVDNDSDFIVSGVFDDFPSKSHLEFDMVLPIEVFDRYDWFGNWWSNMLITYVKIETPEKAAAVEAQLPGFMDKYFGDDFKKSNSRIDLKLEPFEEIYFNYQTRYDEVLHGDFQSISILFLVAMAILFIASFNHVNLSIAQSLRRAKEVGVRKVLGARKGRLILQFLGESLTVLLVSIGVAIGIGELIRPFFNTFFELDIVFNWFGKKVLVFFFLMITSVLITSGLYPALLVASFKPISVLKSGKNVAGNSASVRKGLVIAQFAISIFMIVATILITIQTDFLNSKDLGFDKEAVVVVNLNNSEIRDNEETFRELLRTNPNILNMSTMSGEPGGFHDATIMHLDGVEENLRMRTVFTDIEYLNVFDMEIQDGRNFSKKILTDEEGAMIINETALLKLGMTADEVLGRRVKLPSWNDLEFTIIGIAKDYHFSTLKDKIEPLAIMTSNSRRKIAIRINGESIGASINLIESTFETLSPNFPIGYSFLDEKLARLYSNEQKQIKVFAVFSGLSVFLACMGIFGLAAYSAQQRQKEFGIRKVLGATTVHIIGLISWEFFILVIIAAAIAIPGVWVFMEQWLEGFAYRISVIENWHILILGSVATMLIALTTVVFKTYKSAVSDPTESIRNE